MKYLDPPISSTPTPTESRFSRAQSEKPVEKKKLFTLYLDIDGVFVSGNASGWTETFNHEPMEALQWLIKNLEEKNFTV